MSVRRDADEGNDPLLVSWKQAGISSLALIRDVDGQVSIVLRTLGAFWAEWRELVREI